MHFVHHDSMSEIDATSWNILADAAPTPLLTHEWLLHLERGGGVGPQTGWAPQHLTVHDGDDLVAALPLYRRDASWGEFVFDFAFAEVAERVGARYYPKVVGMSPVTPSPAFALLTAPGREDELADAVMDHLVAWTESDGAGALQFNFVLPEWRERLARHGMVVWEHHGYEWRNEGFATFDDYLARFRKNQRRNIRRERASMGDQGLDIRIVSALDAPEQYFVRMAEFYLRTNAQFGPYAAQFLETTFFTEMPEAVRRHVWFAAAHHVSQADDDPVALAFLVRGRDRLLGRYWGTRVRADNLHFELCYYAPIDWAIAEGIPLFDPGMGSEHKVRRGFRSVKTFSLHRCTDPHMQAILVANMDRINSYEEATIEMLDAAVPYKELT